MYQAHNFNYPVNVRLLRKWLGTINTFFYIIKIMFRYDASTNEDPAIKEFVVSAPEAVRARSRQSQSLSSQKPVAARARNSQIASRLIQARSAGEKRRSQVFLSHIQFSCGQDEEPEAVPSRRARATIIRVFCFYSVNTSARGKTGFAVFSGNNSEQSQKKNSSLCKGSMLAVITGPINTQLKKGINYRRCEFSGGVGILIHIFR